MGITIIKPKQAATKALVLLVVQTPVSILYSGVVQIVPSYQV